MTNADVNGPQTLRVIEIENCKAGRTALRMRMETQFDGPCAPAACIDSGWDSTREPWERSTPHQTYSRHIIVKYESEMYLFAVQPRAQCQLWLGTCTCVMSALVGHTHARNDGCAGVEWNGMWRHREETCRSARAHGQTSHTGMHPPVRKLNQLVRDLVSVVHSEHLGKLKQVLRRVLDNKVEIKSLKKCSLVGQNLCLHLHHRLEFGVRERRWL